MPVPLSTNDAYSAGQESSELSSRASNITPSKSKASSSLTGMTAERIASNSHSSSNSNAKSRGLGIKKALGYGDAQQTSLMRADDDNDDDAGDRAAV
jgi:hypothetical protein